MHRVYIMWGRSQSNNYSGTTHRVFISYSFLNLWYILALHSPYPKTLWPASHLWKRFIFMFQTIRYTFYFFFLKIDFYYWTGPGSSLLGPVPGSTAHIYVICQQPVCGGGIKSKFKVRRTNKSLSLPMFPKRLDSTQKFCFTFAFSLTTPILCCTPCRRVSTEVCILAHYI